MKRLFLIAFLVPSLALAQRDVLELNGTWQFEQTIMAFPPGQFTRTIPVPGLITSAEPQIEQHDRLFPRTAKPDSKWYGGSQNSDTEEISTEPYEPRYNWYRRTVFVPAELEGREAVLTLLKSKYVTQVYVNGQDMGTAIECYTPLDFNITRALQFGEDNEILIKVGDRKWLPTMAAGSYDKEKVYYIPGIWDDVFLSFTGKLRIHRALVLPDIDNDCATVKLQVESFYPTQLATSAGKFNPASMDVVIREKSTGKVAGSVKGIPFEAKRGFRSTIEVEVPLPDPHLWTLQDPFLYLAEITIHEGKRAQDRVVEQFGMREFGREGKFFTLNGERLYLRGTNITLHRFFEDLECRQLPWDREWVSKLLVHYPKQLNWNAMRVCVGILPDSWYGIADESGLLFQNEWLYWQEHGWNDQIRKEYTDWVWSDGNHPSIAIWDALNENWVDYIGNELIPELKQLDSTRIWDAGYMTAAHMADDEMDEPHPYQMGSWRPNFEEYFTANPNHLGDLHFWGPRSGLHEQILSSGATQLVNEYAWIWLWRDGSPSKLTYKNFRFYLGDAASPDERWEMQAYYLQAQTEWIRTERSVAGVLAFTYLTNNYGYTGDWWIGPVKDLNPAPALQWFRHCFAPVAVFIDQVDQRYTRHTRPYALGESLSLNLVGVNDWAEEQAGRVILKVLDDSGHVVREKELSIRIPSFGKRYLPVTVELPEKAGGYLLLAEFYPDGHSGKPVLSRRYIKVGDIEEYRFYNYAIEGLK